MTVWVFDCTKDAGMKRYMRRAGKMPGAAQGKPHQGPQARGLALADLKIGHHTRKAAGFAKCAGPALQGRDGG
jgi:hypothetical protein